MRIWWVEDYLSGNILENRHYLSHEEAVEARERLGYGHVRCFDLPDDGGCPMKNRCKGCD